MWRCNLLRPRRQSVSTTTMLMQSICKHETKCAAGTGNSLTFVNVCFLLVSILRGTYRRVGESIVMEASVESMLGASKNLKEVIRRKYYSITRHGRQPTPNPFKRKHRSDVRDVNCITLLATLYGMTKPEESSCERSAKYLSITEVAERNSDAPQKHVQIQKKWC